MNTITTRIAPAGARFSRPSAQHLASIDAMVAHAAAFGGGGRMTASASDIAPTDPAPAAPSNPADTAARLDNHEARITGLEQCSPPPVPVDTGAQAAVASVPAIISGPAIYARMNSRPTGQRVAAAPSPSAMIQTAAGPILSARAIHDRNNAAAAARAGRGSRASLPMHKNQVMC